MASSDAQAELQALLRFLTKQAKVPLPSALPKYSLLRKEGLSTPEAIAKADLSTIKLIFEDEKTAKQVHNAAKRASNPKKRSAPDPTSSPSKVLKATSEPGQDPEAKLALPETDLPLEDLRERVIETNRAPLFLAFAVVLLKYTHPNQPLSSRLSLAQAVTSAGAQSKAKYIGLTSSTAEDEGWAQGQPKITIMGRETAIMRRHITATEHDGTEGQESSGAQDTQMVLETLWGLNLEALKKSNGPLVAAKDGGTAGPPIHTPEAARAYLIKSIDMGEQTGQAEVDSSVGPKKKLSTAAISARKVEAVAILLKAIDHVCKSWSSALGQDELDRRANTWYARVRPSVEPGRAGWGQRGTVALKDLLALAKT